MYALRFVSLQNSGDGRLVWMFEVGTIRGQDDGTVSDATKFAPSITTKPGFAPSNLTPAMPGFLCARGCCQLRKLFDQGPSRLLPWPQHIPLPHGVLDHQDVCRIGGQLLGGGDGAGKTRG